LGLDGQRLSRLGGPLFGPVCFKLSHGSAGLRLFKRSKRL